MVTASIIVSIVLAAGLGYSATLAIVHHEKVLAAMAKAGVAESRLTMLGLLKALGAIGLVVGLGLPPIGTAAAAGVTLYFLGAIITHLRAGDHALAPAASFGLLAIVALGLQLSA
jgi:hypothetical protein